MVRNLDKLNGIRGVSLTELLVTLVLFSVTMVCMATIYISASKFFDILNVNKSQALYLLSIEDLVRKVNLANEVIVTTAGGTPTTFTAPQVKIRWDYDAVNWEPNGTVGTPSDLSDDTWMKYAFVFPSQFGTFHRNLDGLYATNVSSSDEEVMPGLEAVQPYCYFTGYSVRPAELIVGFYVRLNKTDRRVYIATGLNPQLKVLD